MRHYAYFFTRQDISPEYQVVQTAHAAFQLGVFSQHGTPYEGDGIVSPPQLHGMQIDPRETYFTVVGVRNLTALNAVELILNKFGFAYEAFFEPDLNGGEHTSIAVYPIAEDKKGPLDAFNLLTIGRK